MKPYILMLAVALLPLVASADVDKDKNKPKSAKILEMEKDRDEAQAEHDKSFVKDPARTALSAEQIEKLRTMNEESRRRLKGLRVTPKFDQLTNSKIKSQRELGEIMVYVDLAKQEPNKESLQRTLRNMFNRKYGMTPEQWNQLVQSKTEELFYIDETAASEEGKLKQERGQ